MLLGSGLPRELWSDAVMAAAYVTNRSPTTALEGKVPDEVWFGRRQSIKKLSFWMCR